MSLKNFQLSILNSQLFFAFFCPFLVLMQHFLLYLCVVCACVHRKKKDEKPKNQKNQLTFFINQIYKQMKIKHLLLAAAAMVMAVACNDPVEPTPEVSLSVEPTEVVFEAEGGEQTVAVAANAAWTAEPSAEWITLDVTSGTEGQDVKVTAAENEAEEAREGKVVFTAGEKKAELVVKQDAAEPEPAVVASATITIREDETTESYIAFNITTENVVAASYSVLESEFVDETITAEYILSEEGGYALYEEELNSTIEIGHRNGVTAGTEYTIFLAYEDEEGAKAMVTETVTTPGTAAVAYYVEANSVDVFYDDLYGESIVTFAGEEHDMVIYVNTEVRANTDYFFVVEPGEKGVTYAEVRDHATRKTLAELSAGYGSFSIFSAEGGLYFAMADFMDDSGLSMGTMYEGAIEGIGGGGGGAVGGTQEITFAVASATVARHMEYPGDNSIWELVLTSADGDSIGLAIETGYDDAPCIVSGIYDVTTAPDLAGNVGVWVYSWFQIGNGYYSMYDPEISFLGVESAYPAQDINVFNGMFVVMDYLTGNAANIYITTPTPIAIYGNMQPSEPSEFEWAYDGNLSAKAFIDTEFGESDIRIYNNDEGLYVQVVVNTTELIDKDFYFYGEAFGATEWILSACVKKADTHEVVTTLTDLEFSIYQNNYTNDPGFYVGCYGDTSDGGYIGVDYIGLIDGLELPSAEVEDRIFVIASATAQRSEDYPDDDSVWYLELTSTTGDVVGFTFDQIYGAEAADFFVGGAYQVALYIDGETPCIDQACSWNEFGGSWQVNENEGLMIESNYTGDRATSQYIFNGQLTAIDVISGNPTAVVTFVTDGVYINIEYL